MKKTNASHLRTKFAICLVIMMIVQVFESAIVLSERLKEMKSILSSRHLKNRNLLNQKRKNLKRKWRKFNPKKFRRNFYRRRPRNRILSLKKTDEEDKVPRIEFDKIQGPLNEIVQELIKGVFEECTFLDSAGEEIGSDGKKVEKEESPKQDPDIEERLDDVHDFDDFNRLDSKTKIPKTVVKELANEDYIRVVLKKRVRMEYAIFEEKNREVHKLNVSVHMKNNQGGAFSFNILIKEEEFNDNTKAYLQLKINEFLSKMSEFVIEIADISDDISKMLNYINAKGDQNEADKPGESIELESNLRERILNIKQILDNTRDHSLMKGRNLDGTPSASNHDEEIPVDNIAGNIQNDMIKSQKSKKESSNSESESIQTIELVDTIEDSLDNESGSIPKKTSTKEEDKVEDAVDNDPEVDQETTDQIKDEGSDTDEDQPGNCLDIGCKEFDNLFTKEEAKNRHVILRITKETKEDKESKEDSNEEVPDDNQSGDGSDEEGDKDKDNKVVFFLLPSDKNFNAVKLILQRVENKGWLIRITNTYFEFFHLLMIPTKRFIIKKIIEGLDMLEIKLTQIKALNRLHVGDKDSMDIVKSRCQIIFRKALLDVLGQDFAYDKSQYLEHRIDVKENIDNNTMNLILNYGRNDKFSQISILEFRLRTLDLNDPKEMVVQTYVARQDFNLMFLEFKVFPQTSMFNMYSLIEDYFKEVIMSVKTNFFTKTDMVVSPFSDPNNITEEKDFESITPVLETPEFEAMSQAVYTKEPRKIKYLLGPAKVHTPVFLHTPVQKGKLLVDQFMKSFYNNFEFKEKRSVEYYAHIEEGSDESKQITEERVLGLFEGFKSHFMHMN